MDLEEAKTIKSQVLACLKTVDALLVNKTLPKDLQDKVAAARVALRKRWQDLEKDADGDGKADDDDGKKVEPVKDDASKDAKSTEEARKWLDEAFTLLRKSDSLEGLRDSLEDALKLKFVPSGNKDTWERPWVRDVFADNTAVYDWKSKIYKIGFIVETADNLRAIKLGEPQEVEIVYAPVGQKTSESQADIQGDFVPLIEKAVRKNGAISIKLIQPGWGSSGYYSPEVLERDGAKVFVRGTKMFVDHPTASEETERPERSIKDLAAELVTDAKYDAKGSAGPGLYAEAKVFEPYQNAINELAPHIGVSIRALGKATAGEAEGKKGPVIQEIAVAKSIDFVTIPGAGGKVLELFESMRGQGVGTNPQIKKGVFDVTEEEAKRLQEAGQAQAKEIEQLKADNAKFREALLLREARDFVATALAKVEMQDLTRNRLLESLAKNPPIKENKLDTVVYETTIAEVVKQELDYLSKLAGGGAIKGMGESKPDATAAQGDLEKGFRALGLSEAAAKIAARGR